MKTLIPLLLTLSLFLSACGTPTPASTPTPDVQVGTIVAQTAQAMTAAAAPSLPPPTAQPSGNGFTYNNVSFAIPGGIATGASGETVPRVEATVDGPYWEVAPEYTRITLQGYILGERFHQPQIFVYPAEEFAQMSEGAATTINELRTLMTGTAPLPLKLPHLPIFNAGQMFTAQAQMTRFGSGRGVRYITQYAQALNPITNDELFYTFQGMTSDGKYYVAVQLPISVAMLDTMPTPDLNDPNTSGDQWNMYIEGVTTTLNSLGQVFFSPTLDTLDTLVNSITIVQ